MRIVGFLLLLLLGYGAQAQSLADTLEIQKLSDQLWENLHTDLEKADSFARLELKKAERLQNEKFLAEAWNDQGLVAMKMGNFSEALRWHKKALAMRQKIGYEYGIASSWSKIGVCQIELHQLEQGLKSQLEALQIFKKLNRPANIALTYNNLCAILVEQKKPDQIKKYAKEALLLSEKAGDSLGMANAYGYLASGFEQSSHFDKALELQQKAYHIASNYGDKGLMISFLNNVGYTYGLLGKKEKSLAAYEKCIELVESLELPDTNGLILYKANAASKYLEMRKYENAMVYLRSAGQLAEISGLGKHLPQIYGTFLDAFARLNQADSVVKYHQKFAFLKEEQFSNRMAESFANLQTQYEIDIREQEKKILRQENELKNQSLRGMRYLIGGLVILILFLALVFFLWQSRQKARQLRLKAEAEAIQSEELSLAVIKAEEEERKRIGQELHDGIGQQMAALGLEISMLVQGGEILKKLNQTAGELRSVSHSMMAHAVESQGLKGALDQFFAQLSKKSPKFHWESTYPQNSLKPLKETLIFRMIQELVQNILKHAQAHEVYAQLHADEREVHFSIEDDGIGFDPHKTKSGAGMTTLKNRAQVLNGTLEIESQPGKGTLVSIRVPIL
jgi:signal transduction histidine kinase